MPIPPLYGHEGIRNRLVGAIASSRLPQAILLEGPQGVGKQRLALWLAQALVCENPSAEGGCGTCRPCRLVLNLSHPDVHWFVPLEPARAGGAGGGGGSADADKQVEQAREALAEEMAERRDHPLWPPPSGMAIHSIAAVRLMLRDLALKPAQGSRKVFVVGDAERLVPQTGTEAAANALLKALEEPPGDTTVVLTSAVPEALLPTILSRVVHVRVARLADSVVAAFVQRELGVTAQRDIAQRVAAADGRPGRLLADGGGDMGGSAAERFLAAIEGGPVARYAFALGQQPFQARGGFTAMLDGLLQQLRERARSGRETGTAVAAISQVLKARELAQGNVNPQLLTAVMADAVGTADREDGEGA